MKKSIPVIIAVISFLLPKNAAASFDLFKDFIEIIGISEEDVTVAVNEYIGHQIDLQEKTTDTANQKAVKKLSRNAIKMANAKRQGRNGLDLVDYTEFYNTKLSNLQWPGIDAATDAGEYTTPQTKKQTALSYFKKQHVRNDVQVNLAKDIAINNMAIDNLAIDYANGLSTRYNLQEEMKRLASDENPNDSGEDIQTLEWNYSVVMRRANHRWLDILRFEASNTANELKNQANGIRVDNMSELIGEEVSEAEEQLHNQGVRIPENGSSGVSSGSDSNGKSGGWAGNLTVGDVARNAQQGINAIKNKNFSTAFDSMSALYGGASSNPKVTETLNKISGKVSTGQNVYNNAANENYEGAASTLYDEGKGYYDNYKAKQNAGKNGGDKAGDKSVGGNTAGSGNNVVTGGGSDENK